MIHLLCITVRPTIMLGVIDDWLSKASDSGIIDVLVTVNTVEQSKVLGMYNVLVTNQSYRSSNLALYQATLRLADKQDDDLVIPITDDVYPSCKGWDDIFLRECKSSVLVVDEHSFMGIPVMSLSILRRMNFAAFHPSYNFFRADDELMTNVVQLGVTKKSSISIEHRQARIGWKGGRVDDELDTYMQSCLDKDDANYRMRQILPLEKRLEVDNKYKLPFTVYVQRS